MKRREFLKTLTTCVIGMGIAPEVIAGSVRSHSGMALSQNDIYIKDYLHKMESFNKNHEEDVYLDPKKLPLLKSSRARLKRLQRIVGHGNFQLLNFDEALKTAKNYSRVGAFSKAELDFLEIIFYDDASFYGFFGDKPFKNLTDRIRRRDVVKIRNTGNYLYYGTPLKTYKKIKRDLGNQAILTSGVRSIIKQFLLFLDKAYRSEGNLSLASRSLAPPGCSFHSIGDFDVGQVGFGAANFTEKFTKTQVFKKLKELSYIDLRYTEKNMLGVRYEPWHVKIRT